MNKVFFMTMSNFTWNLISDMSKAVEEMGHK